MRNLKYRIKANGHYFNVQYKIKFWPFWIYMANPNNNSLIYQLNTLDEAHFAILNDKNKMKSEVIWSE